jgi:hypothetical protein
VVLDVDDLHLVEVELDDQPLDRPGVAVLARLRAHPGERPQDAPLGGRVALAGVAGGPRVDHGQREVLDAALAHGRLPLRVGLHGLLAGHELLPHDLRLHALDVLPRDHAAVGERDHRLIGGALGALVEHHERLAGHGLAGLDGRLGGLVQRDEHEPRAPIEALLGLEDRRGGGHLVGAQRLQGMGHPRLFDRGHAVTSAASTSSSRTKRPILS